MLNHIDAEKEKNMDGDPGLKYTLILFMLKYHDVIISAMQSNMVDEFYNAGTDNTNNN